MRGNFEIPYNKLIVLGIELEHSPVIARHSRSNPLYEIAEFIPSEIASLTLAMTNEGPRSQ